MFKCLVWLSKHLMQWWLKDELINLLQKPDDNIWDAEI